MDERSIKKELDLITRKFAAGKQGRLEMIDEIYELFYDAFQEKVESSEPISSILDETTFDNLRIHLDEDEVSDDALAFVLCRVRKIIRNSGGNDLSK